MTSRLRDAFDDLTADVAPFVVGDDLGGFAWRAGRRRRARRLLTTSGLAVAAVAVLAVAVVPGMGGPRALTPAGGDAGVTGYPQRIEHQWRIGDLPDRPGPVAGLVELVQRESGAGDWHVLSGQGRLWRLSPHGDGGRGWPALSRDGRRLGHLDAPDGPFAIRDLVTGETTAFPAISDSSNVRTAEYRVNDQAPNFWSPDGSRLLLQAGHRPTGEPGALLLGLDESLRFLPRDGLGFPAGWAADDELVWAGETGEKGPGHTVTVTTTDLSGAPVRAVTLRPEAGWQRDDANDQWAAVVSPGGDELLYLEHLSFGQAVAHRFSLRDGSELSATPLDDVWTPCGASWAGDVPVVPLNVPDTGRGNAVTALLEPAGASPVVVADPGLETWCAIWASDALAGEPHGWPFGVATAWWTWWWREILIGLSALVALSVLGVRLRRSATPPAPGTDRGAAEPA